MSLIPSDTTRASLELRYQKYQGLLPGSPALEYLMEERRLTSEAIQHFRLGYTGDAPEVGDPASRLCIPYLSWSGPIQLRFRALPGGREPKYLGSSGSTTTLFNTLTLRGMDETVYVTEGELDCITAWQCGLPTVGVPGSENWKSGFWRLFRYRTVVVLCDGDDAGKKLGVALRSDLDNCKIVTFPEKQDVNSFFVEHGRDELRKFVGADK